MAGLVEYSAPAVKDLNLGPEWARFSFFHSVIGRTLPLSQSAAPVTVNSAIPLGFLLGGIAPSEGDPWLGILLVPLGAILLFIAVLQIIISAGEEPEQAEGERRP